jgi:hypothetical protein
MAGTQEDAPGERSVRSVRSPEESSAQRYERNWTDILQELRVTQTGTQILTGFLLALAFQQRFTALDAAQRALYLVLVVLASVSTALALTPVSLHRWLFRDREKKQMVTIGNTILRLTLIAVGLLIVGVTAFIFDVVVGPTAAAISGGTILLALVLLWMLVPVLVERTRRRSDR